MPADLADRTITGMMIGCYEICSPFSPLVASLTSLLGEVNYRAQKARGQVQITLNHSSSELHLRPDLRPDQVN